MNSIRSIQKLNERELEAAVPSSGSWHTDYRDTAYIYIGGLGLDLSEGDVITIFSQYGDPVWIKLARDKETGKSRGFAWLKYEDQRSCDLAVDNLSGASVMGRLLAVDHTRYKKRDDEIEADGYVGQDDLRGEAQEDGSETEDEVARPMIREEVELEKLLQDHDDDDPMKAYMVQSKKEEISKALAARGDGKSGSKDKERRRHHRHRSRSPRERRRRRSRSRDHERRRKNDSERGDSRDRRRDRTTDKPSEGHDRAKESRRQDDYDRERRHRSGERHERRRDRDRRD